MLRVKEPKTRGKQARHQAARIDPSDIVILLGIAYGKLGDEEIFLALFCLETQEALERCLESSRIAPRR